MKYFKKRELKKYLFRLENGTFPGDYIESHSNKIECLKWLIAYYEGRTVSSPKELLVSLINSFDETTPQKLEWIRMLYNWIYYKQIMGF
jgi:hypothetical protein